MIDQFTKYLTVENIALHEVVEVIPNVLSFTYIQNSGAAFSILEGQMLFFYIVTVIVIIFLLYYMYTEARNNKILGILLSIVLAGAIGNFIDRLLYQYVIDMIQLEFVEFAIFNVADSYLTVGVILLLIYTIFEERILAYIQKK
jgi:signal peptidase II